MTLPSNSFCIPEETPSMSISNSAWPNTIRAAFEPARTVETGKPSYRFENIKGGL